MPSGVAEFRNAEEAKQSPLASKLFSFNGITRVFYGADFISVTKTDDKEWAQLKAFILSAIMEQFSSQQPLVKQEINKAKQDDLDSELVLQIKDILDTRVRPSVAQDGGDIEFQSFEKGIVYLRMRGACAGCPSSTATLKSGIERMLHHYVPEVLEVRAVED